MDGAISTFESSPMRKARRAAEDELETIVLAKAQLHKRHMVARDLRTELNGARAALRERFKKGVYAKTAAGEVGVVREDASTEGYYANQVQLRIADGSATGFITVDRLTEASEAEIAAFKAA